MVIGENPLIRIGGDTGFGPQTATFIAGIRGATTGNADALTVVIDSAGQLGTLSSSERFKTDVESIDKASEVVLSLKPVTFHYKNDSKRIPQFGLIAEDVAKVNPNLVVRDANGEIYTVRYDAVNAMLLNEFLKEHRKVEELESTVSMLKTAAAKQEAINAEQRREMEIVTARLKEQDAKIQKVSDKVEMNRPAPQIVVDSK
jgi:hypothetical protein